MLKTFKNMLTVIISAIALVVSIKNCDISKEAQKTAQHALKISQEQFFTENRPFILLKPVEFLGSKSFFQLSQEGSKVVLKLQYQIKNIGKSAAKDLILQEITVSSDTFSTPNNVNYKGPSVVTFGPGDEFYLEIKAISNKSLSYFTSGSFKGIDVRATVTFVNELNKDLKYKITVRHFVEKNNANLIESELKNTL